MVHKLYKKISLRKKVVRWVISLFGWLGLAVLYYIGFSFFFDTPVEYRMKHETDMLRREYEALSGRMDTLDRVLANVIERDRNVFRVLFEAEPYELESDYQTQRFNDYEQLLARSNRQLGDEFTEKLGNLEKNLSRLASSYRALGGSIADNLQSANAIPAIQPVINRELTLLTTSYGMRIHPFYKRLTSHQGVDYSVPVGSRVFATADGTVREVISRNSTSGLAIVIDHGNGYQTRYAHLSKINVSRGQKVHRGDIIALTGNTGLSLAPHLHYEVLHDGMRVDPVHYFFMELGPDDYQRIMKVARSGMQSFD
ncbi:MAG: M23 family metallopeptidase [Rikenellaceae bacterium]|nr:M23 family metallopeptidase [Rikenellaceae bacterium]